MESLKGTAGGEMKEADGGKNRVLFEERTQLVFYIFIKTLHFLVKHLPSGICSRPSFPHPESISSFSTAAFFTPLAGKEGEMLADWKMVSVPLESAC